MECQSSEWMNDYKPIDNINYCIAFEMDWNVSMKDEALPNVIKWNEMSLPLSSCHSTPVIIRITHLSAFSSVLSVLHCLGFGDVGRGSERRERDEREAWMVRQVGTRGQAGMGVCVQNRSHLPINHHHHHHSTTTTTQVGIYHWNHPESPRQGARQRGQRGQRARQAGARVSARARETAPGTFLGQGKKVG